MTAKEQNDSTNEPEEKGIEKKEGVPHFVTPPAPDCKASW